MGPGEGVGGQLGGGTLLPGVDGDAYFQEGTQVGAWKDRAGCHRSHFRAVLGPLSPASPGLGTLQKAGGSPVPTYPSGRRSRPASPASSAPSPGCAGWPSARPSAPGRPDRSGG